MSRRDYESGIIVIIMGCLGIVTAFIEFTLNDQGILLDELITGSITISDVMAVTIVIWLLIGLIIAALR